MDHDPHNYKRRLERQLLSIEKDRTIPSKNKKLITQFIDFTYSEGITTGRVVRYVFDLKTIAQFLKKDFEKANKTDIQILVRDLEKSGRFAKSTLRDFKLTLRKFYKWLRNTDEFPEEVKWFKTHIKYKAIKKPEEMLTEEEIQKMINYCYNPRDRAFISVLYESGCRIGELLILRINQVKFDNYGALLLVNGKTGFRRVRVVSSVPYLTEWMNKHPLKDTQKEFLWINRKYKMQGYSSIMNTLHRAACKAKIEKRVNPHNFRHSRASYLANHLTEAQMNEYFGWVQGSEMASIYVHLSGRDVDNALLKVYGIENNTEKKESVLKPIECTRCQEANQATNKYCSRCGIPLDPKESLDTIKESLQRKNADQMLDSLLKDQNFREMFIEKLSSLQQSG